MKKLKKKRSPAQTPKAEWSINHMAVSDPAPTIVDRRKPFRASTQHPGGTIQVQTADSAIRVDFGSEDFGEFAWEWMDLKTAKWLHEQLGLAIQAATP